MTSRETTGLLALGEGVTVRRRWRDRLCVFGFGAIQWPWLARSLHGGSRAARARLLARLGLPSAALPNLGSWKADVHFLDLIVDHVERTRPRMVVELGAGATTLVLAQALRRHGGGQLVSFDQHDGFVAATRDWLATHGLSADLRHAPLAETEIARDRWYRLPGAGPVNLVHTAPCCNAANSTGDRLAPHGWPASTAPLPERPPCSPWPGIPGDTSGDPGPIAHRTPSAPRPGRDQHNAPGFV